MNLAVKILLGIVFILLMAIGILCHQLNVFDKFLIFLAPMALIRLAHSILLMQPNKN